MKILIDADGCPVVAETLRLAAQYHIPCIVVCDTSHEFQAMNAEVLTVSKGADSTDFALVHRLCAGDIVVTQDYGLAAMCLTMGAAALRQDGLLYTDENITALLTQRHLARKLRSSGQRLRGPAKRTAAQDQSFTLALIRLLESRC